MSNSFVIPWTVAHQASLSTGFSRQEYWSGLSFPSPGDLPDPEIKPMSPVQEASLALQADSLPLSHQDKIFKNFNKVIIIITTTLGSITMNKARGGDRIPAELFHILKDDAIKMLHSIICQQIWKAQQWPPDWKRSVFILIPKKGNAKECSNYYIIALISYSSRVMLKILQARLQQYLD